MGWLGNLFKKTAIKIASAEPTELTYAPSIKSENIHGVGEAMEPDSCYIELYLESLRLERARKFASRFQGVVYSFLSLSREGEEKAQLTAVSKPENLIQLDQNSLDKVITISKQMMAPTAFRGNPVSLELGLFSVKSGNLLTPFLDFVTKISDTAGISFVGKIKPFVPLITEGMDMIAGQTDDTELEVGLDTDLQITESCVSAIIAKPKGSVATDKLSLDDDFRLLEDGQPLRCGYAVFSLRKAMQKPDYGEIPELKEKYDLFKSAVKANKQKDALEAFVAFRLAAIVSPDLIKSDAQRLIEKVKEKYDFAFPPGGVANLKIQQEIGELSEIGLYS